MSKPDTQSSDGKVTSLVDRLQKARQGEGEVTFVLCPCNESEPEPMIPIVLHDATGPLIIALMCPTCEAEQPILNGRLVNE